MNEQEATEATKKGLEDLLFIGKNLRITGPAILIVHLTEGRPTNYGFELKNNCCISRKDMIK